MTNCTALKIPYASGELRDYGEFLRPGGEALTERAIALAKWRRGDHVADIGCGKGAGLEILERHGIAATGVEPAHRESVEVARGRFNIVDCGAESLPFLDRYIDGILSECSFSLLKDKTAALGEFARVLKPGGRLVITDLYARMPLDEPAPIPCLAGLMERREIEALIRAAGLNILVWEDHSVALTELVGRVLFEYGTLDVLWGSGNSGEISGAANSWMMRHRPGYMLLMAAKDGGHDHG